MAGDVPDTCLAPALPEARELVRRRAPSASTCCGLCVKTWTALPPISSMRSIAFEMPAGGGDVGAEEHVPTILPPCPSASAWLRRRPVSCTSEACARSSSTGSSRAAQGGECLLRIENTDTSREVEESVEQIERSLRWLGIEWDGETTFQLDVMERAKEEAQRLVAEGAAYEDEGAIRIRMPDEGSPLGRRHQGPHRGAERRARGSRPRPLGRPADVQLRLAARGLARRHHARHPRRRPRLEHAEADQRAARARRRAAGLRARAERVRRRRQEALEAARRGLGRRVPRGGLPAGGAR